MNDPGLGVGRTARRSYRRSARQVSRVRNTRVRVDTRKGRKDALRELEDELRLNQVDRNSDDEENDANGGKC